MAALVQSRSPASATGGGTTIADTFASNVTAGNTICVRARIANAANASTLSMTCADNLGNTYTRQVQTGALPDDKTRIAFFTAPVTTGGACTVTMTVGASVDRREILLEEVSGLDNASLVAETLAATGSGTAPSAGLLTLAGGGYLMSGFASDQGYRSGSVGSGWTSVAAAAIWTFTLYGRRIAATGGDYAADFTVSPSDSWVAIGLALNDAGGGGGSTLLRKLNHFLRA
jgi:hypothetical protein